MSGTGGDAGEALRAKWNQRYVQTDPMPPPAAVLTENAHMLPASGRALDLACGLGANALFLAKLGLDTTAWDLSAVAIDRLAAEAAARDIALDLAVRDVEGEPPAPSSFDVIVVSHFLHRVLMRDISAALRPAGLIYYQTFVREAVSDRGPSNPVFRLETNELLRLFQGLTVRVYREEGRLGDLSRGTRDVAMLVAQRAE